MLRRMITRHRHAVVLLVSAMACNQPSLPRRQIPVQEPSVGFLKVEVDEALDRLRQGRTLLGSPSDEAANHFDESEQALQRLSDYFLPVLEARQLSYRSYQLWTNQQYDEAATDLERTEQILLEVARQGGERVANELREPLEQVSTAHLALVAEPEKAQLAFGQLVGQLNHLLLKGRLVLGGTQD